MLDRLLDRLRWSWRVRGVYVSLDLSMVNRPSIGVYGTEDRRHANVGISWGNGNSDPVWLIDVTVRVPRVVGERLVY